MRRRASVTFVCSATGRSENNRSIHAITALTRAKCLRSGWTINHISRERTGFGPLNRETSGTPSPIRQGSSERPKPVRTAFRANSESLTTTDIHASGSDAMAFAIQRACGKCDQLAS